MIEPFVNKEETMKKLEEKKKKLESELEKRAEELRALGNETVDIVALHRKHTNSVVFSGSTQRVNSTNEALHNVVNNMWFDLFIKLMNTFR